jgi:RNA 2',3'-cyclic 3'-phosphodiesterase
MSSAGKPRLRLFFALLPDAATRERIAAAADALPLVPPARIVPRENFHLTLAFVGDIPASRVPVLVEIGRAQRIERFSLRFDRYEHWPEPAVLVAAAGTFPPALERLWRQLHRELAKHHWAPDPERLRPHVTLARKVLQAPVFKAMSLFDWPIPDFSLMCSDSSGAASAYTVVDTWSLLDDASET